MHKKQFIVYDIYRVFWGGGVYGRRRLEGEGICLSPHRDS